MILFERYSIHFSVKFTIELNVKVL
jgi:hypothetical protein